MPGGILLAYNLCLLNVSIYKNVLSLFFFSTKKAFYTQDFEIPWRADQSQPQIQKLPEVQAVLNSTGYGDLNSPAKFLLENSEVD